jgi:hypothetical protein
MYFAMEHPEMVAKVVTLDNLRVPFVLNNKMKILSFRSSDPNFKTDPGVLPSARQAVKDGIDIVKTPFQHTEMSDRGPDSVKEKIQATLDQFLGGASSSSSELSPNNTDKPLIANPPSPAPSASAPTAPVVSNPPAAAPAPDRSGS